MRLPSRVTVKHAPLSELAVLSASLQAFGRSFLARVPMDGHRSQVLWLDPVVMRLFSSDAEPQVEHRNALHLVPHVVYARGFFREGRSADVVPPRHCLDLRRVDCDPVHQSVKIGGLDVHVVHAVPLPLVLGLVLCDVRGDLQPHGVGEKQPFSGVSSWLVDRIVCSSHLLGISSAMSESRGTGPSLFLCTISRSSSPSFMVSSFSAESGCRQQVSETEASIPSILPLELIFLVGESQSRRMDMLHPSLPSSTTLRNLC